ncbi:hypothetical protein L7F22_049338 [Adiantum nelumboides]|nr:hypothetical protein [Adiantum nelumboides]
MSPQPVPFLSLRRQRLHTGSSFRLELLQPGTTAAPGGALALLHPCLPRVFCSLRFGGHAAAGGCMMALAHDYRYMRSDRGFIMLNEVEIKLPLTPGMNAIIKSKLPVPTYHEAVLTAHRYVGKTAATAGIIHGACSDVNSTRETAVKKASELASRNYDRPSIKH